MTFPSTERTTPHRKRERVSYERVVAHAILDEALHCHVGFLVNGHVRVLPTLHARLDETLYLHGSPGAGAMLAALGDGLPVCVAVTHLDALVLSRSWVNHSVNYRSLVIHGRAHVVTAADEKWRALAAFVDKVGEGRSADSRAPSPKELARTAVLAITLREASVKARIGGVKENEEDLALPYWAGVIPLRVAPGSPEPDSGLAAPLPAYLRPRHGAWLDAPTLRGELVELSALDMSHVDGLFAAVADPHVYRYLPRPLPTTRDELAGQVAEALRQWHRGERVPFVQRCARTGRIIGTTSFYRPDETLRCVEIGYSMLARDRWGSGVNRESKRLLLAHAFETLGAVRVTWQTDVANERSQRAVERLGATREGVLRSHRRMPDGSWRDSVLYAMTRDDWTAGRFA